MEFQKASYNEFCKQKKREIAIAKLCNYEETASKILKCLEDSSELFSEIGVDQGNFEEFFEKLKD